MPDIISLPTPPKRTIEYVSSDYTLFNAFIEARIEKEKALFNELDDQKKDRTLRRLLLITIICAIFTASASFGVFMLTIRKNFSLYQQLPTSSELTLDIQVPRDQISKLANDVSKSVSNLSIVGNSSHQVAETVLDFTIFHTINLESGRFEGVEDVTTGYKYPSSASKEPSYQYCYAKTTKVIGNRNVTLSLAAKHSEDQPQREKLDHKTLSEVGISHATAKELFNFCRFK